MVNKNYISKRYATALFQIGLETSKTELLLDDLTYFKEALVSSPYAKIVLNKIIPLNKKKPILDKMISSIKFNEKNLLSNFLRILHKNNKLWCFDEIYNEFRSILMTEKGEIALHIESAELLTQKLCKIIAKSFKEQLNKKAVITNSFNTELLGGAIYKYNYKMLDCSLRNRLQKIQNKLLSVAIKS